MEHSLDMNPGEKLLEIVADSYLDVAAATDAVRSLLRLGVDPNYVGACGTSYEGMFPLILAVAIGNINATMALIDAKADINQCIGGRYFNETNAVTALQQCCVDGNIELVRLLVNESHLECVNCNGKTAFLLAVESGNAELIECLAQSGCNVNGVDDLGNNAVHLASRLPTNIIGDVISILEHHQVDFNQLNNDGLTPLKQAAMATNIEAVKAMVKTGQCILGNDNKHLSELELTVILGESDKTKQLLNNCNRQINNTDTLCLFIRHSDANTVDNLLQQHIELRRKIDNLIINAGGVTPLLAACMMGNIATAKVLLSHGADPGLPSDSGVTPLKKAVLLNHLPLVHLLLSHEGATCHVNCKDAKLLQLALFVQNVAMSKLLIGSIGVLNIDETSMSLVARCNDDNLLAMIHAAGHHNFIGAFQSANDESQFSTQHGEREHREKLQQWLQFTVKNPTSLQGLCRLVVRLCIGGQLVVSLGKLTVPALIKDYILLREYE
ncbi:hypothetical protein NP493_847g01003 [Ridgeia piscesae]|uniref:SOCS box domain-containing protein n=1 Tax=Ridgeia piscesae TaxID=27915 RepID=A0AAD9KMF2_RIDPI|nr:hypothetical protein NP493_847g01003 [Ridgeia piscesae]